MPRKLFHPEDRLAGLKWIKDLLPEPEIGDHDLS